MFKRRSLLCIAGIALGSYACHRESSAPAPTDSVQGASAGTTVADNAGNKPADPTDAPSAKRTVPTENAGVELRGYGAGLRPRFASDATPSAKVTLPLSAEGAFEVATDDARYALKVSQVGAKASKASVDKGLVRYDSALGEGTSVMHRVSTSGTEDYVRFEQAPAKAELAYRVELGNEIAGLHEIAGEIEFVDAQGTPRLRVARPYGIDANGQEFAARLSVSGCATDKDPRLPWGRAATPPGAAACTVHVAWSDSVNYPAVIDPAWVAAGDLPQTTNTWETLAVAFPGGKAVAIVREGTNNAYVFDPVTATWAAGGTLPQNFAHRHRIVHAGGERAWYVASNGVTARYDVGTNVWTTTAALPGAIQSQGEGLGVSFYQGDTVFVTGAAGQTYAYDVANNTYAAKTTRNRTYGFNFAAVRLDASKFMVTGGGRNDYAVYNMETDVWTLGAATPIVENNCSQIQPLSNGRILAYGGPSCGAGANWARIYDYVNDQVSATIPTYPGGSPNVGCLCARISGTTYGSKHLIASGRFQFDEGTNAITDQGLPAGYVVGTPVPGAIVKLADGRSLALGGGNGTGNSNKSALYAPSEQADCPAYGAGAATPVFDNAAKLCKACDGDNGGATALKCPNAATPVCQSGNGNALLGQCTECGAGKDALCTGTKPTCNVTTGACAACERGNGGAGNGRECKAASPVCAGDGSCAKANGDNGTAASAVCPTAANPYAKADGTCGKCVASADCAAGDGGGPVHAGLVCNSNTGACGNTCAADGDCKATEYCVGSGNGGGDAGAGDGGGDGGGGGNNKSCSPKKADGAACAEARECATAVCTNGACGVPVVDAGSDAATAKDAAADTGASSSSSSGGASSSSGATSSSSSSSGSGGESTSGGGCDCSSTRSDSSSMLASLGLLGAVGMLIRRRQRRG